MNKQFCDICEKPATKRDLPKYDHKFGKPFGRIEFRVHANFNDRSDGYGGRPDLCEECILDAMAELKKAAEKAK